MIEDVVKEVKTVAAIEDEDELDNDTGATEEATLDDDAAAELEVVADSADEELEATTQATIRSNAVSPSVVHMLLSSAAAAAPCLVGKCCPGGVGLHTMLIGTIAV